MRYENQLALNYYQNLVKQAVIERGFDKETVSEVFTLLIEEIGELAKAIRHFNGQKTEVNSAKPNLEDELADVLWLILDLANRLDINIEKAFISKENKNRKRKWK